MGATVLHGYQSTVAESGSGGGTGIVGPNEWNAAHQLYLDVNAQTGTSYAIAAADIGSLVTFNNASAVAVSIAQAVAGAPAIGSALNFNKGWFCFCKNRGVGAVTITPTTSTIGGNATLILNQGDSVIIVSDGVNYQVKVILNSANIAQLNAANNFTAAHTVTIGNANALAIGANGATNPVIQVDTSTSSVATGIKIKGAAAASGAAISVISSGSNENLTIDAKGTGTITIGGTSTGSTKIGSGINSTSTTTGDLVVNTGLGIGGNLYIGGSAVLQASALVIGTLSVGNNTGLFTSAAFSNSDNFVNIANGGNATLPVAAGYSVLMISETQVGGDTAIYLMGNGHCSLLGAASSLWVASTTTPAAGKFSVASAGSNIYKVYNNFGIAAGFRGFLFNIA